MDVPHQVILYEKGSAGRAKAATKREYDLDDPELKGRLRCISRLSKKPWMRFRYPKSINLQINLPDLIEEDLLAQLHEDVELLQVCHGLESSQSRDDERMRG